MTEDSKKNKPRGFAGVLYNQMMPLNDMDKFKEKYKDTSLKLLLNATDGRHAALITIENGAIDVEGIPNKNKEDLTREVLEWDGRLETTTSLFLDLGMGKLGTGATLMKLITRKMKIKGMKKVLMLMDLFALLDDTPETQ